VERKGEEGSFGTDGFVGVGEDFGEGFEDGLERDGFGAEAAVREVVSG
jgi:hypothetical protein